MRSLKTLWMLVSLQTQSSILERRNRPQLIMAICMPAFQILNGINYILFYAPVLFQALGFGNASLYSSALLISGGIQMFICQIHIQKALSFLLLPPYNSSIFPTLAWWTGDGCHNPGDKFNGNDKLSKGYSVLVLIVTCLFVMAIGWCRWPLGRTVPSEIFPLETRSAGQSITVAVNLLFAFHNDGVLENLLKKIENLFFFLNKVNFLNKIEKQFFNIIKIKKF